jgi:type VI secretion system protein ImpE
MIPEDCIKSGNLDEALAAAQSAVRADASNVKARIFLFQVNSLFGHWEKAKTQLQILAGMNAESSLFAQIFAPVLDCELLRAEIFAGRKSPIIFGEPENWMGLFIQASQLAATGEYEAAQKLRDAALESAPPIPGKLNGESFSWLADSDTRMGPLLEVIMDGCYRWVPFHRIASISFDTPNDLRDLIWFPAKMTWTNGGGANAFVPVRYPGTENCTDSGLKLSRKTDWIQMPHGLYAGQGQRMFVTDQMDYSLLDIRSIEFLNPEISGKPIEGNA